MRASHIRPKLDASTFSVKTTTHRPSVKSSQPSATHSFTKTVVSEKNSKISRFCIFSVNLEISFDTTLLQLYKRRSRVQSYLELNELPEQAQQCPKAMRQRWMCKLSQPTLHRASFNLNQKLKRSGQFSQRSNQGTKETHTEEAESCTISTATDVGFFANSKVWWVFRLLFWAGSGLT